MGITYGDHLIDTGQNDITPEQEREIEAREECARRGIDPDEICADGGVTAWMVVDQERTLVHPNGAPMFAPNGTMLDADGNRSVFDDVDADIGTPFRR
jgi:hypothetical protein